MGGESEHLIVIPMLRSLILLFVLTAPVFGAKIPDGSAYGPHIQVTRGRAVLAVGGESPLPIRGGGSCQAPTNAYLEICAGSTARLDWLGQASLEVRGPATLDWSWVQEVGSTGGVEIQLHDWVEGSLEVRHGSFSIGLVDGWKVKTSQGVLTISSLPSELVELRLAAGPWAEVTWVGDGAIARPPFFLRAGQTARLRAPTLQTNDGLRGAFLWQKKNWPWRSMRPRPGILESRQQVRPLGDGGPLATTMTLDAPAASVPVEPEIHSHSIHHIYHSDRSPLPHGLGEDDFIRLGLIQVERSPFVEHRLHAGGRVKILVSFEAPRSMVCRYPEGLLALDPGTVVLFEKDGSLHTVYGLVQPID